MGPPERAREVIRELLEFWRERLKNAGRDPEDVGPRHVALSVFLATLILLGGGRKGAVVKVKAVGVKGVKVARMSNLANLMLKVFKILAKMGMKVTVWIPIDLTLMVIAAFVYWRIALRVRRFGSVTWLRGLALLRLQKEGIVTGLWCLGSTLPVLFGYFSVVPFSVVGVAVFVLPAIMLARSYREDPVRFPVALYSVKLHPPRLVLMTSGLVVLMALLVTLSRGVLYGEAVGTLSAVLCSVGASLAYLHGLRLARRLWLPREAIPS
ncbi:hypothetical protein [Methanopyrus sp.]